MNFYEFSLLLEMPMMASMDLPDEVILIAQQFAGNRGYIVYYADKETGQETEESGGWPPKPTGQLDMHKNGDIWQLGNVHATKGWGPMLYEIAIEHATANGLGMMADRREMSSDAIGVFAKYYSRSDVKKTPLPAEWIPPEWKPHPELHYYYSIPGQPMTKDLIAGDQLVIR